MIAVFTDGACSGNPGPGGWACIIADDRGDVRELAGRANATTNNRMELTAAIEGIAAAPTDGGVVSLHSDSTYVLSGITDWIVGWKRRGWKTADGSPVKNEDLWRRLEAAVIARGPGGVAWRWVRGHSGHDANERCDELAVAMSRGRPVTLFAGALLEYPHGSLLPSAEPPPRPRERRPAAPRRESGPVAYLSFLEGRLERHSTWDACSARVKGRSGARFKKVRSVDEEREVRRSWGVD